MSFSVITGMPSRFKPADRAELPDAQARADREADQVWQVRTDSDLVCVDEGEQPAPLFGSEAARRALRWLLGDSMRSSPRTGLEGMAL